MIISTILLTSVLITAYLHTDPEEHFPQQVDIAVIGGGAIGCSIAYWLKKFAPVSVAVIEKDPVYRRASTVLSCGGIRQQFSCQENIQMSLFGSEFLRNIKENLSVLDIDPPEINFAPHGYLVLSSDDKAELLKTNNEFQRSLGAKVELLSPTQIKDRWPWINVSDVALGSYGTQNEGWFDPYLFLQSIKRKAHSLGAQFIHGDVVDFEFNKQRQQDIATGNRFEKKVLKKVLVKTPDNTLRPISFAYVVNAAGPWAGHVASLAGVGTYAGEAVLPVSPRKQSVFVVSLSPAARKSNAQPGIDSPWISDFSGLNIRREGFYGDFLTFLDTPPATSQQNREEEPVTDGETLEVNYDWFDQEIWPRLAHRVPAMQGVKVRNAWAGFYDYNSFDQNLIIGPHPYHNNLIFCNGSSGHGIQHSLAIGRAVAELCLYNKYKTLDLSRMCFDRLLSDERIVETGII